MAPLASMLRFEAVGGVDIAEALAAYKLILWMNSIWFRWRGNCCSKDSLRHVIESRCHHNIAGTFHDGVVA